VPVTVAPIIVWQRRGFATPDAEFRMRNEAKRDPAMKAFACSWFGDNQP
jgi:hypothetical protein